MLSEREKMKEVLLCFVGMIVSANLPIHKIIQKASYELHKKVISVFVNVSQPERKEKVLSRLCKDACY
jgi:hypothetical protein